MSASHQSSQEFAEVAKKQRVRPAARGTVGQVGPLFADFGKQHEWLLCGFWTGHGKLCIRPWHRQVAEPAAKKVPPAKGLARGTCSTRSAQMGDMCEGGLFRFGLECRFRRRKHPQQPGTAEGRLGKSTDSRGELQGCMMLHATSTIAVRRGGLTISNPGKH